jgi:hypothetical protein
MELMPTDTPLTDSARLCFKVKGQAQAAKGDGDVDGF